MSITKPVKQYDENKLRIGKFYDVNKCVERKSVGEHIKDGRDKVARNLRDPQFYKRQLYKRIPMLEWLISYKLKAYLQADIVSGFTVGIMNIPQGMGYALLASLPPVAGLYISFFPLIIYAIFGTCRHLAIGAIAIVSLLTGSVIDSMVNSYGPFPNPNGNGTDTDALNAFKIKVACSLSLLVGVIQFLMGVCGLGIVSSYFSRAFISGYTCGSAFYVLTSQIPEIFGLKGLKKYNGAFKIPLTLVDIISKLGSTNIPTLILSLISLAYLIVFKELVNPIVKKKLKLIFPSELLLVVVTTILFTFTDFKSRFKVEVVGAIPKGLPHPNLPDISLWPKLIKDAIIIALIAFSISTSLGTLFSRKHKYKIDTTQELVAYGLSNVFGSFFSCYPSAAALSRSSVLESTGNKTSLGPLLSSLVILIVILFLNPFFQPLPQAVLACIITVALKHLLFQVKDLITFWKYSKLEAIVWFASCLGVICLDVDIGLVIGILISVFTVVIKDQLFKLRPLKKYTEVYVDKDYVISKTPRKIETGENNRTEVNWQEYEVVKVQSAIYFANSERLKKLLEKRVKRLETEVRRDSLESYATTKDLIGPDSSHEGSSEVYTLQKYLLLDFAAVNHIDTDGIMMLKQLIEDYKARKIAVYICQFQDGFIRMSHCMNLIEFFDPYLYLTIQDAINDIERGNYDNDLPRF